MCSEALPHTKRAIVVAFAATSPSISVLTSHLSCLILCIYYYILFHSIVLSMAEYSEEGIDLKSLC
jgi:hypothetical protein